LNQNYPNPFNNSTTIEFELAESKQVTVDIYDFNGNHIKSVANSFYSKGKYTINWDASSENGIKVASGIYFCVLKANNQQLSRKMIYIK
jgi:flagellar hook assembly protein FlgD